MVSCLTLQQLQDFHTIDRRIFARLVLGLGVDPSQSQKVVAFWNWLEGRGSNNFVWRVLALTDSSLDAVANETIMCLNLLNKEGINPSLFTDVDNHISLMRSLVSEDFSFRFVYQNRGSARSSVDEFIENVCARAFRDIVPKNLTNETPCWQPHLGFYPIVSYRHKGFYPYILLDAPLVQPTSSKKLIQPVVPEQAASNLPRTIPIPADVRTLIVTFPKARPVTQDELKDVITRYCSQLTNTIDEKTTEFCNLFNFYVVSLSVFLNVGDLGIV